MSTISYVHLEREEYLISKFVNKNTVKMRNVITAKAP